MIDLKCKETNWLYEKKQPHIVQLTNLQKNWQKYN